MVPYNERFLRSMAVAGLLAVGVSTVGLAQATSVDQLEFPSLGDFDIAQPERLVLDNGMVVLLLEDHELPLVDAFVRIRTGGRLEPADRVGLAGLTGTVLRTGGTASMGGDELDEYLEGKAAMIETSIGTGSGSAGMSCLTKDFPEVFRVFSEVLRRPVFDQDKLEVAKKQVNAAIARQNDSPMQIMRREFREVIYGEESSYARSPTYTTIDSITREDLAAWHARYFRPSRMILGLVGDFDSKEAKRLIQRYFGDWPPGPEGEDGDVDYNKTVVPGVFYVEKNDMTQSNIIMGHLGIRRDDADYFAVQILNEVFGASQVSRLFTQVRSKKGLAYAVTGAVGSSWDHEGVFQMWMTTKTGTTGAGIDALLEEARRISTESITVEELDRAKSSILNSFVFNSDTRAETLAQQMTYEYHGYPVDWLERYRKGIEAVTVSAVGDAAAEHIRPDEMAILVVGPAEGRDKPLSDYGPVQSVDISIPELASAVVEVTVEGVERGRDVIGKAIERLGGAARLAAVESLSLSGATTAQTPQGEFEIQGRLLIAFPDRLRQELSLPFGDLVIVMTPEAGFMQTPQGVQPLPDSQRAQLVKDITFNLVNLLRQTAAGELEPVAAGSDELDGARVELVRMMVGEEMVTLGVDPVSGEILSLAYRGVDATGAPGEVVTRFSDYRSVNGLMLPFKTGKTVNGEPATATRVIEMVLNGEVDESAFVEPAS